MGECEPGAARIHEAAGEVFAVGEGDRVDEDIDAPEPRFRLIEDCLDLGVIGDVAQFDEVRADAFGQRADALFERGHGVGEGDLRAGGVERLRDTPGDGVVVRHPEDERGLAG